MEREIHKWYSKSLDREMETVVYGYYGYALLMFPAEGSDFLEFERTPMIDSLMKFINSGTLKVYSVNNLFREIWLNKEIHPEEKALRQQKYNKYIEEETVDFIFKHCNGTVPIVAAGVSMGAYNAANIFFRRPELFAGVIAMSGSYDLRIYSGDYFDDNCYFNSPVDFISNLNDPGIIENLHSKNIIIACGQGAHENPDASRKISQILHSKQVPHWLDLWGFDMPHDWVTWCKMLPYYLDNINI